jgi:hypothetical protein
MCLAASGVRHLVVAGAVWMYPDTTSVEDAVRFLADAPVNVARLTVMFHRLSTQEWLDLVHALGGCHALLTRLVLRCSSEGPLMADDAGVFLAAAGGLRHLRRLQCDGVGALVLLGAARWVTVIGGCFLHCLHLSDPVLDLSGLSSLRRVGDYFAAFSNVSSVVLPPSLVSAGAGFLLACRFLVGCLDLAGLPRLARLGADFARGSSIDSVKLPPAVVCIGGGFLRECVCISGTVDLSGLLGLRRVADWFAMRSSAAAVLLPANVTHIGRNFLSNTRAVAVDVSNLPGLLSIGGYFAANTLVRRVGLPGSLGYIGGGFLHRCSGPTVALDLSHLPLLRGIGDGTEAQCDVCHADLGAEAAASAAMAAGKNHVGKRARSL